MNTLKIDLEHVPNITNHRNQRRGSHAEEGTQIQIQETMEVTQQSIKHQHAA